MPAKGIVPVGAFPWCIDRFRGHGPLLQGRDYLPGRWRIDGGIYKGSSPCWYVLRPSRRGPSGPRGGHGPLLQGAVDAPPAAEKSHAFVGAGHARESDRSG